MTLSAAGGFLNHQGDKDRPPIPIGFPETANHGGGTSRRRCDRGASTNATAPVEVSTSTSRCRPPSIGCLLWTSSVTPRSIATRPSPATTGAEASTDRGGEVVPGVRNPVVEPCARTATPSCRSCSALRAMPRSRRAMRWVEEEGALDDDLCGRDWEPWIDEMKNGTLPVEDGHRAMTHVASTS